MPSTIWNHRETSNPPGPHNFHPSKASIMKRALPGSIASSWWSQPPWTANRSASLNKQAWRSTSLGSWFWKSGNSLILGFLPLNKKSEFFIRRSLQGVGFAHRTPFLLSQCPSGKSYLFSGADLCSSYKCFFSAWLMALLKVPLPKKFVIFKFGFTQVLRACAKWGFDPNLTPLLPSPISFVPPSSKKAKLFGWKLACATVPR